MADTDDERVFLDGHIDVPPDRLAAVSAALPLHIRLTRAEPGCLSFSVVPSQEVNGRFIVSEVFTDEAAFEAHQQRMRTSEWFEVTRDIPRHNAIRKGRDV